MKVKTIGTVQTVMQNPCGNDNYFGWPSVANLQNGKIAVVASGYRYQHVCPFGKAVIAYSEDEGETYTAPAPCICTPLDDRDAGILPFGDKGVLVTSFNNTVAFQRAQNPDNAFFTAYLDTVTEQQEQQYLGSLFRFSRDCGVTFGELHKSPVTSPHGPMELSDGTILWVGRTFTCNDTFMGDADEIRAYTICPEDGTMTQVGRVPAIAADGRKMMSCEPHTVELTSGMLLCHIRVHGTQSGQEVASTYQTESHDKGRTWTPPHRILPQVDGYPAHLLLHSSGVLLSTYGYRSVPYGIRVMFSTDEGKSWETGHELYRNTYSADLGYPCSVELSDGSLLTVFYAQNAERKTAEILQQKWRLECR